MSNIVFKNADGSIAVVHLTPEFIELHGSEDKALEVESARVKLRGSVAPDAVEVGRKVELPADRDFRTAWRWLTDEPKMDICPVAARVCAQNKLRQQRVAELAKLDVAYQRADEEGDVAKKVEVAKQKQALRDAPDTVPEAPADMKVATPEFLDTLRAVQLPK